MLGSRDLARQEEGEGLVGEVGRGEENMCVRNGHGEILFRGVLIDKTEKVGGGLVGEV